MSQRFTITLEGDKLSDLEHRAYVELAKFVGYEPSPAYAPQVTARPPIMVHPDHVVFVWEATFEFEW